MTDKLIKPVTLKGFRDYLPRQMMAREQLIETARQTYRSFGFSPIDTPALEYTEILLGKGGDETDKQMFRFIDQGGRDVAMRFDLTIPFARFAAQHLHEICTPFKRYHIGTVWRAEKPQKGRYREFMQCDFDTIGTESNTADIETVLVIHDLMENLGFGNFKILISNRMVLNGLLEQMGLADRVVPILRVLDKLFKVGRRREREVLEESVGLSHDQADKILKTLRHGFNETPVAVLDALESSLAESEVGLEGVSRLRELFAVCNSVGISERVRLDVSIARGLDYYTGTVYETFLTDLPEIGSVCSGGRYDNLAGLFTKQTLPGVGASLGLDRLLAAMDELGKLQTTATPAQVLVILFDAEHTADYLQVSQKLRAAGIDTEVYPDARPLKKQLKYADRRGFRLALIAGTDEFAVGNWQVKDLVNGKQQSVPAEDLVAVVKQTLSTAGGDVD